jgi:hypothetical protein
MRRSAEVKDTLLHFDEVFSAADLEGFARIITQEADESVAPTPVTGQKVESGG